MKAKLDLQTTFDFDLLLPPGREWFKVPFLAVWLNCSEDTVTKLIQIGDLKTSIDLSPSTSTKKSMLRVHRTSLVEFLNTCKTRALKL